MKILFLLGYYNDGIIINIEHHFYTDEKLFELFCIRIDFAKYFIFHILYEKCRNLFI